MACTLLISLVKMLETRVVWLATKKPESYNQINVRLRHCHFLYEMHGPAVLTVIQPILTALTSPPQKTSNPFPNLASPRA